MTPSNQQFKAILFDLDGTLLDSFPAHYRAYEVTLTHFNMILTPELYKQTYSPNWLAMYEAMGIPEERWQEADRYWLAEVRKYSPHLFQDARPLLDALSDKYILGLVTSGSRNRVKRDLAYTEIDGLFQVIVTGDDITKPKPDPQGLLIALDELQILPAQAVYVGDAREDCLMAQAAGVPFVGIAGEFATVSGIEGCAQLADINELKPYIEQS